MKNFGGGCLEALKQAMALPVGMMRLVVRAAPSLAMARDVIPRIPRKMVGFTCRMSSSRRELQTGKEMILGIETSCDDTGAAVVMPPFLSFPLSMNRSIEPEV